MTTITPIHNYTQRAFEGSNYREHRIHDVSVIAKMAREFAKKHMPGYKFSITVSKYTGGASISIALMGAPHQAFATPDVSKIPNRIRFAMPDGEAHAMRSWEYSSNKGHTDVNHYYIDDAYYLTDETREALKKIYKFINSYNYDDSDAQIDYFDTNFYIHMSVGKWDKAFIITN